MNMQRSKCNVCDRTDMFGASSKINLQNEDAAGDSNAHLDATGTARYVVCFQHGPRDSIQPPPQVEICLAAAVLLRVDVPVPVRLNTGCTNECIKVGSSSAVL